MNHPERHPSTIGEFCPCGKEAWHKVGEEFFENENRHNLTTYVCCEHFIWLMGSMVKRFGICV